jgi:type IV pilus assembly protein PilE
MKTPNTPTITTRQTGFTLIEMMIVVAIAAILVSIAATAYTSEIRKSRRTDARNALLDIAAREERYLSVSNSYSANATDVGYSGVWPQNVTNNYYQVSVSAPDTVNQPNTAVSFIATATAINAQASDTACTSLSVNQLGVQTSTGSGTAATCWSN